MKKRILSVLLVVAMLASMVVMPVYANDTATQSTGANSAAAQQAKTICPCCGVAYTEIQWTEVAELNTVKSESDSTLVSYTISEAGHYKLANDISGGNTITLAATLKDANLDKIVFDLNGKKITGSSRGFYDAGSYNAANAIDEMYVVDSVGTGKVDVKAAYNMGGTMFYMVGTNLSVYGGDWVTKTVSKSGVTALSGSARAGYFRSCTVNIYGGNFDFSQETYPAAIGFVGAGQNSAGTTFYAGTCNVYGGTFIGGKLDEGAGDFRAHSNCEMNFYGGDIQGAVVGAKVGAEIGVSGNPTIEKIDLTVSGTMNVGQLTDGASIGVKTAAADTAFTNAGVAAYAKYFKGRYQEVYALEDGSLALDEAVCPHCGELWSEITWTAWENYNITANVKLENVTAHYYLTDDITSTKKIYSGNSESDTTVSDVCIDMRGHSYKSTSAGFAYVYTNQKFAACDSVGGSTVTANTTGGGSSSSVSMLYVSGNAEMKLYDIEFINVRDSVADGSKETRGMITNTTGGTLYADGCTFNGSVATSGTVLYSAKTAGTATFKNCVINGGDATQYGGALYSEGASMVVENTVINGGTAKVGGAIYYKNADDKDASLTIKDSVIYGGTTSSNGAGLGLYDNTKTTIKDSVIYGGTCTSNYGGTIFHNKAEVLIEGSTVYSGNGNETSSGYCSDGVYGGGVVTIKNSVVEDVTTTKSSGVGTIFVGEVEANMHMGANSNVDLDELTDGNIVVYGDARVFTTELESADAAAAYLQYVTSGVSGLSIKVQGKALALMEGAVTRYCPHCKESVEFESYIHDGAIDIMEGGHYYLTGLAGTISSEVLVGKSDNDETPDVDEGIVIDVVIDLNGMELSSSSRVFSVAKGSTLSLMDSVGGAQVTGGYTKGVGNVIYGNPEAKVNLYGGTYSQRERTAGSYTNNGAVIYINSGELNVLNNTVINGGATTLSGGAIYANTGSTVTITDDVVINGSEIGHRGGAIYLGSSSTLEISGNAQIKGGNAVDAGGNIYATGSTVTISGNARIEDGVSGYRGGNLYGTGCNVTISENAVISGGIADDGGNLFMPSGSALTMTGGTISNGLAKNDGESSTYGRGGNLYLGAGAHTISGGTISGGISEADELSRKLGGGNIYVYYDGTNGSLDLSGATVTGGVSGTAGGNIFALGVLNLGDAIISNGSAAECGADIYVGDTGVLNISAETTGDLGLGFHDEQFGETVYGGIIEKAVYAQETLNAGLTLTLDGVRGNVPMGVAAVQNEVEGVPVTTYHLNVADGGVAILDLNGNYEYFADAASAVAAYDLATDDRLVICGAEEIVLTKNAWIDVNGCDITVSGDFNANFLDTANDDYKTFGWVTMDGAFMSNGNIVTVGDVDYYTVKDEGGRFSFHMLDMEITAVALKTKTGGLYYYAKWYCDDTMKGAIDTFGIAADLNAMPTDLIENQYSWMNGTDLVSGKEFVGATINDIVGSEPIEGLTNDQRGEMKLYAAPYVILKTGETIIGTEEVGMSLKDCCDQIDAMITELNAGDDEDKALAAEYIGYMEYLFGEAWKDLGLTWNFENFMQAAVEEA